MLLREKILYIEVEGRDEAEFWFNERRPRVWALPPLKPKEGLSGPPDECLISSEYLATGACAFQAGRAVLLVGNALLLAA